MLIIGGTAGRVDFLGYPIVQPFRSLIFYLEDDPTEIQSDRATGSTAESRVCGGDPRLPPSLLHQFAPVEAFQLRIVAHRMHRRLAPEKAQQWVALFTQLAEPLPTAAWSIRSESSPRSWPPLCPRRTVPGHPKTPPSPTL